MSRRNRERRQRAADALPPVNRVPVNLDEIGVRGIREYGVASWCPERDGRGPAEAVALHLTIDTVHGDLTLVMRLKTARAVDEMIALLERHRNDVWPGG